MSLQLTRSRYASLLELTVSAVFLTPILFSMRIRSPFFVNLTTFKVIMKKLVFIFSLLFFTSLVDAQFYNGSQMEFGKNRVQYNEPHAWQWYKFEKCNVY